MKLLEKKLPLDKKDHLVLEIDCTVPMLTVTLTQEKINFRHKNVCLYVLSYELFLKRMFSFLLDSSQDKKKKRHSGV